MYRWLVAVAALAGCGDNSSGRLEAVGIRDGTRLVARFLVAEGAAVFRHWHDVERGMDCAFEPASDGEYRCLPIGPDATYINYEYADAACSQPVVLAPRCQAPRYAFSHAMATARCNRPSGRAVFSVGPARASRTVFVYRDGVCQEAFTIDIDSTDALYDLGDKLPATDFVAAQLGPASSDALASYTFTADDGAVQADTTWDAARAGECHASERTDPPRCVPLEVALHYDHVWADAACTIQAAVDLAQLRPCAAPTAIVGFGSDSFHFRELGAAVPAADVHVTDMANVCTGRTNTDGDDYYLEGLVIPDDQFPRVTRVLDGTGRLRAERYTDADGNPLAAARGFYDTLAANRCSPYRFPDGTLRCVPYNVSFVPAPQTGGYFADAACTQPVVTEQATSPPPSVIVVGHAQRDVCDAVNYAAVHAAGPPHTGALFHTTDCTPVSRDQGVAYYTLGAAIELPRVYEQ
ncbi:MAG: hypothetical protein H0T89_29750 [Deltaproteobacteria bacterium]|nr:hypothetical protein [Deltaproteobacteria bacterium]MDQ3297839.1 hypothetical protein [Myxococcota bacterium]